MTVEFPIPSITFTGDQIFDKLRSMLAGVVGIDAQATFIADGCRHWRTADINFNAWEAKPAK